MNRHSTTGWAVGLGLLLYLPVLHVRAEFGVSIVVPNSHTNVEGNSRSSTPFSTASRFQQVYGASEFSAIREGGGLIKALIFRDDGDCRFSFGAIVTNLQINLSTTARGPDGLSPTFAENIGSNETVVLPSQYRILSGGCSRGVSPQNFSTVILFADRPFYYDPKAGNLLLDIRNLSGAPGPTGSLDVEFTEGDSISCVFDTVPTATTARFVLSYGFVTEFIIQPFPYLHLTRSLTNFLFRWTNYPGAWVLEHSPVLGPASDWQPTGGIVTTNGGFREVTLPLGTNALTGFYRLVCPPFGTESNAAWPADTPITAPRPNP